MKNKEKSTFFLYSLGEKADVLRLGNLVLRDYANPTLARHHVNKSLGLPQEKAITSRTSLGPCAFHQKTGWNFAVGLDAAEVADVGLSSAIEGDLLIAAKWGERVTITDPESFLNDYVLGDDQAVQKLRLWLSAASVDYVRKLLVLRTPKIWLCTGIYLLADVEVYRVTNKGASVDAGVSSTLVAALGSVPLGPSVSVGLTRTTDSRLTYPEKLVWAAQWRALDVEYARVTSDNRGTRLPRHISLLPDVFSKGMLRAGVDVSNAVQLTISSDDSQSDGNEGQALPEKFDDDIGKQLENAIEEMESYYMDEDKV